MTRLKTVCVIIIVLFLSFVFEKVSAQVSVLPLINCKAGEIGMVAVNVTDTEGKIARIEVVPRGYPDYIFEINDKGLEGDKVAGDDIWSIEINVPFDAPYGKYYLDCTAYDSEGKPIMKKTEAGEETTIILTIVLNV